MATKVRCRDLVTRVQHARNVDDPNQDSWVLSAAGKLAAEVEAGASAATAPVVVAFHFACTGLNKKGGSKADQQKPQSNCWSICGFPDNGSVGCCTARSQRYHRCGYRVRVSATLADVAAGRFVVRTEGSHVPPFGLKRPPSTLVTTRSCKVKAVERCTSGHMLPVQSALYAYAEMSMDGGEAPTSSRFVPDAGDIARIVKCERRGARGGKMADELRVDLLVREQLFRKDILLLYILGVILVLSTRWALERCRTHGSDHVASDAKVDTVHGMHVYWSSIRFPDEDGGPSNIAVAWIAPFENTDR